MQSRSPRQGAADHRLKLDVCFFKKTRPLTSSSRFIDQ
jgi:hypothetical protein